MSQTTNQLSRKNKFHHLHCAWICRVFPQYGVHSTRWPGLGSAKEKFHIRSANELDGLGNCPILLALSLMLPNSASLPSFCKKYARRIQNSRGLVALEMVGHWHGFEDGARVAQAIRGVLSVNGSHKSSNGFS
jgi:hypothetical protein